MSFREGSWGGEGRRGSEKEVSVMDVDVLQSRTSGRDQHTNP